MKRPLVNIPRHPPLPSTAHKQARPFVNFAAFGAPEGHPLTVGGFDPRGVTVWVDQGRVQASTSIAIGGGYE